jgi:diguanylate cyclase (GGDEF)-like protein
VRLANQGFTYGVLALFTYLIASGGIDHTGPMWAYPIVAATIFLQGARRGLLLAAVMCCITVAVFFGSFPDELAPAAYAADFKWRFIATFAALALFVALHEFARARNQQQLLHVSAQLDQLSHTDQLTGLPNRRYMNARLESENSRFLRQPRPYSILFADVDHFKRINDRCGHHAGDHALQTIARSLRGNLRQRDEVGRWGGEEFLILLPDTDQAQAVDVAEKLRAAVAAIPLAHGDLPLKLTMSFGVHTVHSQGKPDTFVHCADQKLYLAKKAGRNRIVADLEQAMPGGAFNGDALALALVA